MYPVVSWPLSRRMRNMPFRSDSVISPSSSTFSSLALMRSAPSAHDGDRRGLGALLALSRLVRHLGTLGEALVARADDPAVMDEQVLPALVGLDEPIPLGVVEPLHCPGCHCTSFRTSRTSQEGRARNRRRSEEHT